MGSAKSFVNFIRTILQNRFMLQSLVSRDIRARYTGSLLGIFWAFIHPLAQLATYLFVFSVVLRIRLGAEYGGIHFAVWLMCGMVPWLFFSEIISRAPGAVLEQAGLIKKTVFPSEILLVAQVSAAMVSHAIMLVILITALLLMGIELQWTMLWVPVYLFGVMLFALGLAWILSSVNAFVRDTGQVVTVLLNLWFFATPVIYPFSLVPESFKPLLLLNPLLQPVQGYRAAILGREAIDVTGLAIFLVLSLVVFVIGGLVFKKLKPSFADVL